MKTKYRIVTDRYCGYEVQFKKWFMPFWFQLFYINSSRSIDQAFELISLSERTGKCFCDPKQKFKSIIVLYK